MPTSKDKAVKGEVYYDAECRFCVSTAARWRQVLAKRGLCFVALQTPEASQVLGIPHDRLFAEMHLRTADGRTLSGARAVAEIARSIWWASPLWVLSRFPGILPLMQSVYRWIAARRSCAEGVCAKAPVERPLTSFLPLFLFPPAALSLAAFLPRWGLMWALAIAVFAGCKWLTYSKARHRDAEPGLALSFGYLFAWPGMDATQFLTSRAPKPPAREWFAALTKTLLGLVVLWVAVRTTLPAADPLVTGWLGMTGAVLLLHFGTFHLLSLLWRNYGINAAPVMQRPLLAASLAEFWGRRWNTAFHELAARHLFAPLLRYFSADVAAFLVFVVSGLIHDVVISVPAGGGYGLPTLYFMAQGAGMALERSRVGKLLGLGSGWRGRLFMVAVAAGPAALLFHPQFIHNVILPMLNAIGSLMEVPMTIELVTLLRIAGIMHLGLIGAGLLMPSVVSMREHLANLPVFIRQLFWVYYSFIGLCLVSFCLITLVFAETLAGGTDFARALCAFFALFWTLRLIAGMFIFDLKPYLTNRQRRVGLAAANIVFAYLPIVYALAALRPVWLQ